MMEKVISELSEFSKSTVCFRFNEKKLKFERINNTKSEFIYSMLDIVNYLDIKNLKYTIEYNQDIKIKI